MNNWSSEWDAVGFLRPDGSLRCRIPVRNIAQAVVRGELPPTAAGAADLLIFLAVAYGVDDWDSEREKAKGAEHRKAAEEQLAALRTALNADVRTGGPRVRDIPTEASVSEGVQLLVESSGVAFEDLHDALILKGRDVESEALSRGWSNYWTHFREVDESGNELGVVPVQSVLWQHASDLARARTKEEQEAFLDYTLHAHGCRPGGPVEPPTREYAANAKDSSRDVRLYRASLGQGSVLYVHSDAFLAELLALLEQYLRDRFPRAQDEVCTTRRPVADIGPCPRRFGFGGDSRQYSVDAVLLASHSYPSEIRGLELFEALRQFDNELESGDSAVVPTERAEPGPKPAEEVDEADLFQETVAREVGEVAASAAEDARADAPLAVEELAGRLGVCGKDYSTAFLAVTEGLDATRRQVVRVLEAYLHGLEGVSFGSLEANRKFARELNVAMSAANCSICCPSCGSPGRLIVKRGTSPDGAFAVRHEGSDHAGRATLPHLDLMPRE